MFKPVRGATLAVALAFFLGAGFCLAAEPSNLSLHKQEMATYVASGEYNRDLAAVASSASQYLAKRIGQGVKPAEKLAIVFDIDETMLSNLSHMVANDYGYVPKVWTDWVMEGCAPAIRPVLALYETAGSGKLAIFIITGRNESERPATERNLREAGYEGWTQIIYRTASAEKSLTNGAFKSAERRKLTEAGYTIVLNIGDQDSDLVQGYAEQSFKLPNPFYKYD